ncbi:MAG: hypothetical protein A2Z34_05055 [Planctomycetes bacterium RBG_16_59_8]|nr:MAG: hypothetical protein A2Z34_05055 [Planctomycetes bacterium RBG_16_59_8]
MYDFKMSFLILFIVLFTASVLGTPLSTETKPSVLYGDENSVNWVNSYLDSAVDLKGIPIPEGYEYWKTVMAKVTAYDPSALSCGKFADGKTSLLDNAWRLDGCAVDPQAIPYRSLVYIPGAGLREADDTGSAMKKSWRRSSVYHIDLRMHYPYQARQWGVKWVPVHLFRTREEAMKTPVQVQ